MLYSVLTYIFDDYDIVQEVLERDPNAEYILITDDPNLTSSTWTVVYDAELAKLPVFEKCYKVRFHPFDYVNTDIVVRIDGDIEIHKSLNNLLTAFNDGNYDRCLMIHPSRNRLDSELNIWVKKRGYDLAARDRELALMLRAGYDFNYKGLFQCSFEIVRKNNINRDINDLTYGILQYTGGDSIDRVDQCIFSFVVNHYFSDKLNVLPVSERLITDGNLMKWYQHHSNIPRRSKIKLAPVMFNTLCKPWND